MKKLTFTMENYLEAIYELSQDGNGARVSDIAEKMGVTKASTNSAMSTLSKKGFITNEKYKEIFLTDAGYELAKLTAEKHNILEHFFSKVLEIDPVIADRDACAIEHVISNESIYALKKFIQRGKN